MLDHVHPTTNPGPGETAPPSDQDCRTGLTNTANHQSRASSDQDEPVLHISSLPAACLHIVTQAAGPASRQTCKDFLDAYGQFYQGLRPRGLPTTARLNTILAHSPRLRSILKLDLSGSYSRVRDSTLGFLANACTSLQSLNLNRCFRVTDYGLISLSPRSQTLHTLSLRGLLHNGSATLPSLQYLTSLKSLVTPEYHSLFQDSHLSIFCQLSLLTHLEVIPAPHLADNAFPGGDLFHRLLSLPNLTHLSLPLFRFTTEESVSRLSNLGHLTQLSHLELTSSSGAPPLAPIITSAAQLTNLRVLQIESPLSEAHLLSHFTNVLSLERLSINLHYPGADIAHLACLPSLTHLSLSLMGLSSLFLTSLATLSGQLKHLILSSHIASFNHISALSNLERLQIQGHSPDSEHHPDSLHDEWQLLPSFFPHLQDLSICWLSHVPRCPSTLTQLTCLTRISIGLPKSSYYLQPHLSEWADCRDAAAAETAQIFESLTNLQHLMWPALLSKCQDDDLQALSRLQKLTNLDLSVCENLNGSCLQHLPSSLQQLCLAECFSITTANFMHLSMLSGLQVLDISGCPGVRDVTFWAVGQLKHLRHLDVSRCDQFEGWGLSELRAMTELSELVMADCQGLKDDGLLSIGGLPDGLQRFQFVHAPGKMRVRLDTIAAVRKMCTDVLM